MILFFFNCDFCIFNKNIDAMCAGFIITIDRKEKMDFVYAIVTDLWTIVVPVPGEESRLFAFIGPFQPMVSHRHLGYLLLCSSAIERRKRNILITNCRFGS